jgi:glucose/arabinose dehydrogenase
VSPDKYDGILGNPFMTLIAYKHGVYMDDANKAGWIMGFVPTNSTTSRLVRFTVFDTNGTGISPKDITIPNEKFSELVGTFDGKTVRLFVNRILMSQVEFKGNYSGQVEKDVIQKHNNFLTVAGDAYCTCNLATGIFDEIRYYNYSLGADMVKRVNSLIDVFGKGLVGYWKFDGTLNDNSQFRNDMFYNTLIASMAFAPDGRLFYTEKNSGNVRIMINDSILPLPFVSIPDIHVDYEQGLLGLGIDNKFGQNHFVYVYYNYKDEKNGNIYARVVRFTDLNNSGADPVVILDKIPASSTGFHTGGALMFNPIDDKLYVTVGDAIDNYRAENLSSLNGKTLRLNRDGTIPRDNPFPNSPVYTYGHRNMFGIAFDDKGHGIVGEPGSALYDEINSHIKGGDYGWPKLQSANMAPNPLANDSSIKPLRSYYVTSNPTQAIYYNGDRHPELKGKFIVGSFRGNLYAYKISEDGKKLLEEIIIRTNVYPSLEVVGIASSPSGEVYFGAYDIYKLGNLDSTSRIESMDIVGINTTNLKVSKINFSEPAKDLSIELTDVKSDGASLSIKIPKNLTEDLIQNYKVISKSQQDYPLEIGRRDSFNILKIKIPPNAPEKLQITLDKSKVLTSY